jgi:hypothetical protein
MWWLHSYSSSVLQYTPLQQHVLARGSQQHTYYTTKLTGQHSFTNVAILLELRKAHANSTVWVTWVRYFTAANTSAGTQQAYIILLDTLCRYVLAGVETLYNVAPSLLSLADSRKLDTPTLLCPQADLAWPPNPHWISSQEHEWIHRDGRRLSVVAKANARRQWATAMSSNLRSGDWGYYKERLL